MAESQVRSFAGFMDALIVGAPLWRAHGKGQGFRWMLD